MLKTPIVLLESIVETSFKGPNWVINEQHFTSVKSLEEAEMSNTWVIGSICFSAITPLDRSSAVDGEGIIPWLMKQVGEGTPSLEPMEREFWWQIFDCGALISGNSFDGAATRMFLSSTMTNLTYLSFIIWNKRTKKLVNLMKAHEQLTSNA